MLTTEQAQIVKDQLQALKESTLAAYQQQIVASSRRDTDILKYKSLLRSFHLKVDGFMSAVNAIGSMTGIVWTTDVGLEIIRLLSSSVYYPPDDTALFATLPRRNVLRTVDWLLYSKDLQAKTFTPAFVSNMSYSFPYPPFSDIYQLNTTQTGNHFIAARLYDGDIGALASTKLTVTNSLYDYLQSRSDRNTTAAIGMLNQVYEVYRQYVMPDFRSLVTQAKAVYDDTSALFSALRSTTIQESQLAQLVTDIRKTMDTTMTVSGVLEDLKSLAVNLVAPPTSAVAKPAIGTAYTSQGAAPIFPVDDETVTIKAPVAAPAMDASGDVLLTTPTITETVVPAASAAPSQDTKSGKGVAFALAAAALAAYMIGGG